MQSDKVKKIKSALISVFHKDGLDHIVKLLDSCGVTIYSTGGTLNFIRSLGVEAVAVEDLTGYPSILGGRVKTLHPGVFGGILSRRNNLEDAGQLAGYKIPEIDLVIVDLYPFEQTAESGTEEEAIIEKIDIGGISLIRAAAKNYKDVVVAGSKAQYGLLYDILSQQECSTTIEQRRRFAAFAFAVSSHYDTAIFNYFNRTETIPAFRCSVDGATRLRYGENPHQQATYHGNIGNLFEKLHGKDISYNNMLDLEAAIALIGEFEEPKFVIIKHNNACGVASKPTLAEAYRAALAADPVSAFGGVLICNRPIDGETAEEIDKLFCEVVAAPNFEADAAERLQSKKNRILLRLLNTNPGQVRFRSLLGGVAAQERDMKVGGMDTEMQCVTKRSVTGEQIRDLIFANKIVKHLKSNAIVLVRDNVMLGSGVGQTSRVDALKQAIDKAKNFGFPLRGVALASDAFFPFSDCVEIACAEGIETVIQPGGSVRDADSIEFCNNHNMAMVFTGMRHFKH